MFNLNNLIKAIENEELYFKITKILIFCGYFFGALFLSLTISPFPQYDELAYIEHVKQISNSNNFWYLGDRNRMPLFNYLLFIFFSESFSENLIYRSFQFKNIIYVGILSYLYFRKLSTIFTSKVVMLFCTIFTVFFPVFAYIHDVVVEPLFYITFGLFYIYGVEFFKNPSKKNGLIFGGISSILYLLKASGLSIFFASIVFFILFYAYKKILTVKKIQNLLIAIITFFIICSPYLIENYKNYNKHIFYNVNTTFYIWYDSWDEVELGTKNYNDRIGWPNMEKTELPSLTKYLSEHTGVEIANRFISGFKNITIYYFSLNEFTGAMNFSFFLLASVLAKNKKKIDEMDFFNLYYLFFLFLLIFIGAAWYHVIAPIPRFTILIFTPIYLNIFLIIEKIFINSNDREKDLNSRFIIFIFMITQASIIFYQI